MANPYDRDPPSPDEPPHKPSKVCAGCGRLVEGAVPEPPLPADCKTAEDVRQWAMGIMARVHNGNLRGRTASTMLKCAGLLLKSIDQGVNEEKLREMQEMANRIQGKSGLKAIR